MLKKIKMILHGWMLWCFDTKESRKLSEKRMKECVVCPYHQKLTNTCKECGCFLPAKTRVPDAECPVLRW
jgi:hypothetical protein